MRLFCLECCFNDAPEEYNTRPVRTVFELMSEAEKLPINTLKRLRIRSTSAMKDGSDCYPARDDSYFRSSNGPLVCHCYKSENNDLTCK
jgi:hypothetical protein